jgi:hypothetical protein
MNNNKELKCSSCEKRGLHADDLTILSRCGHVVCNSPCLEEVRHYGGACKAPGCFAVSKTLQFLPCKELISTSPTSVSTNGKKLDDMISLLKSIPEGEKALIFVQYSNLTRKVEEALRSVEISFADLKNEAHSSEALTKFQKDGSLTKVLILNIGDASAAGR